MKKGLAVGLVIVGFSVRDREGGGRGLLLVEKQSDPILIKGSVGGNSRSLCKWQDSNYKCTR